MNFQDALFLLPGLIIGLTVHEASHAISAKWLGDRTAEKMGRISLNPMRHLSIYGTLALFFLHFGWGKPVIVNLYNFKKPKFYYLLSSLAGPVSNLIICGVCLVILYMNSSQMLYNILEPIFLINGMLAAINLVPVPPLDGSKIWPCLIPGMKPTISGKWSMIWVIVLIISLQTGGIDKVLGPVFNGMQRILPNKTPYHTKRPANFPQELVAPEGVQEIVYVNKKPNKHGLSFDCYGMTFLVKDDQQGDSAYVDIEKRLTRFGWRKLKYKLDDPEVENHEQLIEQAVLESGAKLQSRNGFWVKSPDVIIWVYRNNISLPDKKSDSTKMIGAMYLDNISDEMLEDLIEYKNLHSEEFAGIEFTKTVAKPEK